jgi:hypothetical protein
LRLAASGRATYRSYVPDFLAFEELLDTTVIAQHPVAQVQYDSMRSPEDVRTIYDNWAAGGAALLDRSNHQPVRWLQLLREHREKLLAWFAKYVP